MNKKSYTGICVLFFVLQVAAQEIPLSQAAWISSATDGTAAGNLCPVFQKTFTLRKEIQSAILYITARGLYEAEINNKRVGNAYFTPGWTSYDKRLQYQQYDVTKLLHQRQNAITVTLSGGWFSGFFGGDLKTDRYGKGTALLLQLTIRYKDGTATTVVSDDSWQFSKGPVVYSDFYNGEIQDTRVKPIKWEGVTVQDFTKENLVPTVNEPVTRQEVFEPQKIFISPKAEQLVDFGQNMAGIAELQIQGHSGDTVKVRYAEALDQDGNFYTGNLRAAKATDIYVLNGNLQTLVPKFTYHGFRYIKVEGCNITKYNCEAIALHSLLQSTGTFSCSDPLINQLQSNINWSLNSNFMDIPTDCPQRSERLGWTGDAQVFCRTAAYNKNVKLFFEKWLADLRADQGVNGGVPSVIPDLYHHSDSIKGGVAGWSDAATIIPWTLYEVYGDSSLLRESYHSMKMWVNYVAGRSKDLLWKDDTYGDWYAPGPQTDLGLIDQCFFAYSVQLVIDAAGILGEGEDAERYLNLLSQIKSNLVKNYFDEDGRAITPTQTAYILPLEFDLLPEALEKKAIGHLVELIHANNDHLATGFLGTPYILEVLTKYGHIGLAYKILNQTTIPSWLYPVTKGATTIWEKWDAIKPDGDFDTCSLNHYAYGAVGNWLYTTVAGIQETGPGYKSIIIAPHPGGGLTWAKASYRSQYGLIESNWQLKSGIFILKVKVPDGVTATIQLPDGTNQHVSAGIFHYKIKMDNK